MNIIIVIVVAIVATESPFKWEFYPKPEPFYKTNTDGCFSDDCFLDGWILDGWFLDGCFLDACF